MFDAPVDAWYVWLGVALASTAALGLAVSLPHAPPPDAASAADTVDSVAASPHPSTAKHPLEVDAVRLGSSRISLRRDGTASHAAFAYGPVVPVEPDTDLWAVLRGTPPDEAFDSPDAFRRAARAARARSPEWRPSAELTVRRTSWEGVDVTLVG